MYTCKCLCMYIYIYTHMYAATYADYACVFTCMHALRVARGSTRCACVFARACSRMYVHMFRPFSSDGSTPLSTARAHSCRAGGRLRAPPQAPSVRRRRDAPVHGRASNLARQSSLASRRSFRHEKGRESAAWVSASSVHEFYCGWSCGFARMELPLRRSVNHKRGCGTRKSMRIVSCKRSTNFCNAASNSADSGMELWFDNLT